MTCPDCAALRERLAKAEDDVEACQRNINGPFAEELAAIKSERDSLRAEGKAFWGAVCSLLTVDQIQAIAGKTIELRREPHQPMATADVLSSARVRIAEVEAERDALRAQLAAAHIEVKALRDLLAESKR